MWMCKAEVHPLRDNNQKNTENLRWEMDGYKSDGKPRWVAKCRACEQREAQISQEFTQRAETCDNPFV